jgi:hypothetical protein
MVENFRYSRLDIIDGEDEKKTFNKKTQESKSDSLLFDQTKLKF